MVWLWMSTWMLWKSAPAQSAASKMCVRSSYQSFTISFPLHRRKGQTWHFFEICAAASWRGQSLLQNGFGNSVHWETSKYSKRRKQTCDWASRSPVRMAMSNNRAIPSAGRAKGSSLPARAIFRSSQRNGFCAACAAARTARLRGTSQSFIHVPSSTGQPQLQYWQVLFQGVFHRQLQGAS